MNYVCVVDDNSVCLLSARQFITKSLVIQNTAVLTFFSAEECVKAIEKIYSTTTKIVILTDIEMPDKNGLEMINQLKESDYDSKMQFMVWSSNLDKYSTSKMKFNRIVRSWSHKPSNSKGFNLLTDKIKSMLVA